MKTINIHGKEYLPAHERVRMAHAELKTLSITTEVLFTEPVVIKATVVTPKGTFTGISAANPAKMIEKTNPYEVAETSAVGRALGFAGYGIEEGIASADEMQKSLESHPEGTEDNDPGWIKEADKQPEPTMYATDKQVKFIHSLLQQKGQKKEDLYKKYNVDSINNLPLMEAKGIIDNLLKLPDALPEKDINDL